MILTELSQLTKQREYRSYQTLPDILCFLFRLVLIPVHVWWARKFKSL